MDLKTALNRLFDKDLDLTHGQVYKLINIIGEHSRQEWKAGFNAAKKIKVMNWTLQIAFHYPHDRFLLGWEYMAQTKEFDYTTIKLYLFIVTLTLDI